MRQLLLLMVCALSLMGCAVSGNAILTGATYEPKHTVAFRVTYTATFERTISLADATEIAQQSAMNECGSSHVTLLEHRASLAEGDRDMGYYHFVFECGS